jgi:hypothetical protein
MERKNIGKVHNCFKLSFSAEEINLGVANPVRV